MIQSTFLVQNISFALIPQHQLQITLFILSSRWNQLCLTSHLFRGVAQTAFRFRGNVMAVPLQCFGKWFICDQKICFTRSLRGLFWGILDFLAQWMLRRPISHFSFFGVGVRTSKIWILAPALQEFWARGSTTWQDLSKVTSHSWYFVQFCCFFLSSRLK